MKEIYDDDFYKSRHATTIYSAETILDSILKKLPPISTAADFGCGIGSWLSYLKQKNIDVTGFEGPWVPLKYLKIPKDDFIQVNLAEELKNTQSIIWEQSKFDLSISLEVAEHLPPELADRFIELLTSRSKFILFSAAIPNQGGLHHVNEQYPSYWISKFAKYNFACTDVIRSEIWNDIKIPFWYRQNIFLAYNVQFEGNLNCPMTPPLDLIHPDQVTLLLQRSEITLQKAIKYIYKKFFTR